MTYADETKRQELIDGLHAIADYLEVNQDVPAPTHSYLFVFAPFESDAENELEIDFIADRIGAEPTTEPVCGHYTASRSFGRVTYRAVAVPLGTGKEA